MDLSSNLTHAWCVRQRWWYRDCSLANGVCGPGYDSHRRLKFFCISVFTQMFQLQFLQHLTFILYASIKPNSFFPLVPLEFLCKLMQAYASCTKLTSAHCSLSLTTSLLWPSFQDETGASRLRWRQKKEGGKTKLCLESNYLRMFKIECSQVSLPGSIAWSK